MESAGVDAGENMLVGVDSTRVCPNASLAIPTQSQAGTVRNNILDPRLRPTATTQLLPWQSARRSARQILIRLY